MEGSTRDGPEGPTHRFLLYYVLNTPTLYQRASDHHLISHATNSPPPTYGSPRPPQPHPADYSAGSGSPRDARLFLGRAYECGFPRGFSVARSRVTSLKWYKMAVEGTGNDSLALAGIKRVE